MATPKGDIMISPLRRRETLFTLNSSVIFANRTLSGVYLIFLKAYFHDIWYIYPLRQGEISCTKYGHCDLDL